MAEENVTSWITFTRWITGQNLNPTSVSFTHSQPSDISEYQRIFDCPILFDQPMVEIHFPPQYAELPIIQHDPVMQKMMDAHAERLLQQFTHNDGFLGDVRKVLIDAMANDNASLEYVASELALTPRTLQRRLSEQDETFKSMLDKTRKALALTYINQSFISLPDLTYLLGFSDQTAFQRAFKKWTGLTPSKYRKQGELK
jgi:AraC-like DNA-binding protein